MTECGVKRYRFLRDRVKRYTNIGYLPFNLNAALESSSGLDRSCQSTFIQTAYLKTVQLLCFQFNGNASIEKYTQNGECILNAKLLMLHFTQVNWLFIVLLTSRVIEMPFQFQRG